MNKSFWIKPWRRACARCWHDSNLGDMIWMLETGLGCWRHFPGSLDSNRGVVTWLWETWLESWRHDSNRLQSGPKDAIKPTCNLQMATSKWQLALAGCFLLQFKIHTCICQLYARGRSTVRCSLLQCVAACLKLTGYQMCVVFCCSVLQRVVNSQGINCVS